MSVTIIIFIIITVFAALNLFLELKRDLMMMQQNSYRIDRYKQWLKVSGDTTSWTKLTGLCVFFVCLVSFSDIRWSMGFILAFIGGCILYLSTRSYKKPVVMTKRAWRIISVSCVLALILACLAALFLALRKTESVLFVVTETLLACYCGSHILIISAVWLLKPIEKHISEKYLNEATSILRSMPDLKIIGITGSYGKTSTKHFLKRILDEKYSVTMTPGSFNTPMGVVRTIRENLKPYDEIFIVEMGAKQRGDIKEICDIVHPTYGILTAVGEQHLESFKTVENIRLTKFELIDALPKEGFGLLNDDFPEIAKVELSEKSIERYSVKNDNGDWRAVDISYSKEGTFFKVIGPDNFELSLQTLLVGEGNISNLLASVVMAYHLGLSIAEIKRGVAAIHPVEHRLSMTRTVGGIIILDDAFNSNPAGAKMALEVLESIEGGEKIIITPGMIELGEREYDLNRDLGREIAKHATLVIVVGEYNRDAILEGVKEGGMHEEKVKTVSTFADAQQLLSEIIKPGDVVLYENDLPDTFK